MKYDIIIGLEIHAELNTNSKMFCACLNDSQQTIPNSNVCPICLGHPGTLPVPNKQAIDWTILVGLALNCKINRQSKFDRKNYFYPDLPKGYQISQYDEPLAYNGYLMVDDENIAITRIHLEEDTGKSFHAKDGEQTLIDFNRAGTPLLEMVSQPIIRDAQQAKTFCQSFQKILRYLEVSQADMEKGEMRCEANISLQSSNKWVLENGEIKALGKYQLNPKVEIKNINSFRSLEKAINYEIKRQAQKLDKKEKIIAETRGWNEHIGETVAQRRKESAADYRYFPEPDIPPLKISRQAIEQLKNMLIELPETKKKRFMRQYSLRAEMADILTSDKYLADFTEKTISELGAWITAEGDNFERQDQKLAQVAANWLSGELLKHLNSEGKKAKDIIITPENFAELVALVWQGKINSNTGQKILAIMYKEGGDPTDIMDELGLEQIDNSEELDKVIKQVTQENSKQVMAYQQGKTPIIQFLIGKVMAATRGKANPTIVKKLLEERLRE